MVENALDKTKRIFEYDCLRLIAILAVVMIHVSADLVLHNPQNSMSFVVGNFFDTLSRFAVPFFVMISGIFMLDENRELPLTKLKHKIMKLFLLLGFWSCFYALVYHFHRFMPSFIYGHFHLWYMYLIIGIYLSIPILRLFVKEKNKNYVYYMILVGIIFYFLPTTLDAVFAPNLASKFFKLFKVIGGGYLVYFLSGWAFGINCDKVKSHIKLWLFLIILSLIVIFCGTQFVHSSHYKAYKIFYSSASLPVFLYSISLFSVIYFITNKYAHKVSMRIKQFISKLSSLSLGVYLIHVSFLHLMQSVFKNMNHGFFYVIMVYFIIVILSFLTTFILSKIKYLNELIKI